MHPKHFRQTSLNFRVAPSDSPNEAMLPKILSTQQEGGEGRRHMLNEQNRRVFYYPQDNIQSTSSLKQMMIHKQILSSSKGNRRNYNQLCFYQKYFKDIKKKQKLHNTKMYAIEQLHKQQRVLPPDDSNLNIVINHLQHKQFNTSRHAKYQMPIIHDPMLPPPSDNANQSSNFPCRPKNFRQGHQKLVKRPSRSLVFNEEHLSTHQVEEEKRPRYEDKYMNFATKVSSYLEQSPLRLRKQSSFLIESMQPLPAVEYDPRNGKRLYGQVEKVKAVKVVPIFCQGAVQRSQELVVLLRFEGVLGLGMSRHRYRSEGSQLNNDQVNEFQQRYHLTNNLKEQMRRLNDKFRTVLLFDDEQIGNTITEFLIGNEISFDASYYLQKHSKEKLFFDANSILADLNIKSIAQLIVVNPLNLAVDKQNINTILSNLTHKQSLELYDAMFPKVFLKSQSIRVLFLINKRFNRKKGSDLAKVLLAQLGEPMDQNQLRIEGVLRVNEQQIEKQCFFRQIQESKTSIFASQTIFAANKSYFVEQAEKYLQNNRTRYQEEFMGRVEKAQRRVFNLLGRVGELFSRNQQHLINQYLSMQQEQEHTVLQTIETTRPLPSRRSILRHQAKAQLRVLKQLQHITFVNFSSL